MKTNRPLTVISLLLSLSMAAMVMTVVSTAMPTVDGDLGGIHLYSWVSTGYLLTSTGTVPLYGKLADLYGRKPVLLAGIGVFLVGSMASGLARGIGTLIAFRALQGLGAGAMQPTTLTIVGDIYNLEERAKMQGLFGAVWGVAGLVGPLLGGIIVNYLSWRWVFFINVPAGIAAAALLMVALHEQGEHPRHSLDLAGAGLLLLGLLPPLVGTHRGLASPLRPPPAAILLPPVFAGGRPAAGPPACTCGRRRARCSAWGSATPAPRCSSPCRPASNGGGAEGPPPAPCSRAPSAGRLPSARWAASSPRRCSATARSPSRRPTS